MSPDLEGIGKSLADHDVGGFPFNCGEVVMNQKLRRLLGIGDIEVTARAWKLAQENGWEELNMLLKWKHALNIFDKVDEGVGNVEQVGNGAEHIATPANSRWTK